MSGRGMRGLGLLVLLQAAGALWAQSAEEVGNELVCQCGCGLVLNNCNHVDCGFAIPARKRVAESLAAGEAKDQIVASFVRQYGEQVLAAPTKKGFNLTVWVLPFAALLGGAVVLGFLLNAWVARRRLVLERAGEGSETARVAGSGVPRRRGGIGGARPRAAEGGEKDAGSGAEKQEYEGIFEKELKEFES